MFLRHSISNIFRSGRKSLLYSSLLLMLTLVLCLGVCACVSVSDFLDECDGKYTTIGLIEYMGEDYPDNDSYDESAVRAFDSFDSSVITDNPCVEKWDSSEALIASADGFSRYDTNVPFRNMAVLIVRIIGYQEYNGLYNALVEKELYSYYDMEAAVIYMDTLGEELGDGFYVVHGSYYKGATSYRYLRLSSYSNPLDSESIDASPVSSMYKDINDGKGGYYLEPDSRFWHIARTYEGVNNCVRVFSTSDVSALYPFNQNKLYLTQGRFFTEEEYASQERVCIVSPYFAGRVGKKLGDTVEIRAVARAACQMYESYRDGEDYALTEKYKIVGITNESADMNADIFVPRNDALCAISYNYGYTVGQAVLKNGTAEQFAADMQGALPDRMRLTVYDQGYGEAVAPFSGILRTAILILVIVFIAGLAILILFGYLFVYRQRESARIMIQLGTGKHRVYRYFFYSSAFIACVSAGIGAIAGYLFSGGVLKIITDIAASYTSDDMRFSSANLSVTKNVEFMPSVSGEIFVYVFAAVVLLSVLFALAFTAGAIRGKAKKAKSVSVTVKKSAFLSGGAAKYALLSLIRGRARVLVPVLVALSAVILFFRLSATYNDYPRQIDELSDSTRIRCNLTDVDGKGLSGIVVGSQAFNQLNNCEYIEDISYSLDFPSYFLGVTESDGVSYYVAPFELPKSAFAQETFFDKMADGPKAVFTNNILTVPQFYYATSLDIQYIDGYTNDVFRNPDEDGQQIAVVSDYYLKTNSVKLGDTVRILVKVPSGLNEISCKIVGCYQGIGKSDGVYIPFYGESDYCNSMNFVLRDASALSEFKDYLAREGYSEVNRIRSIRTFIVIEDSTYLDTYGAITQRIRFTGMLFPLLYALTEAIGFVVAFMLILVRKREIAVMRGLGTPRAKTFFSMFIEQAVLALAGTAAGIAAAAVSAGEMTATGYALAAGFIVFWLAGSALSVARCIRKSAISVLRSED